MHHQNCFTTALSFLSVLSIQVGAQTCPANGHQISEFGSFTSGNSDPATVAANNATINRALDSIGKTGGGTLCLPAGTFFVGPNPQLSDRAITIRYDNITMSGQGVGTTILKTNGTYALVNGAVRRGHGLIIEGGASASAPRKNIVLKNFELDGQCGWSGNYNWPADPATGAGWDITHKGIVPSWDRYVDSVRLENLYVHHYSGEILYVGGMSMGTLTLKHVRTENTNGSCLNLYGADLLVDSCEFGGPSRFWMELTARANQMGKPVNRTIVRNSSFHDAKIADASIVMTQGDFNTYQFTFDNNRIKNSGGVFGCYGGVAGPVSITNNVIDSCGAVLMFNQVPGWTNSPWNANVTMERNTITHSGALADFYVNARDALIRNNSFIGTPGSSMASNAGTVEMHNVVFENNSFKDCRGAIENNWIHGERALYRNNTYVNVPLEDGQTGWWIYQPYRLVTPHFEMMEVFSAINGGCMAGLSTVAAAHGQIVRVTGGSARDPVHFNLPDSTFQVAQNRTLGGTDTIYFRYDSSAVKWTEITKQATSAQSASRTITNNDPGLVVRITSGRSASIGLTLSLPVANRVVARLYNVCGVAVRTLFSGSLDAGNHILDMPLGGEMPATGCGWYVVVVQTGKMNRSMPVFVGR